MAKYVKAFISWLGLTPGKNQSGKMNKRSKKKAMTRSGQIFKQAAQSLLVSKQPSLGAFARKLADLCYKTFNNGMQYVEKEYKYIYKNKRNNKLDF
ncbi:MAG: hypothetical protein A3F91_04760 [Flavobacteria bacterium RIFCSPLOWO2_12_FULL_35_11]|nr:MAG: hypothetical protein A3F91_04760 [Flavobacteria bacterium RIFCSPLOWO2_12_FULL_35_11]